MSELAPASNAEPKEESDSAASEEDVDINRLLLPDGKLPTNCERFGLHYSSAALRGWVRQTSPACAATSVAGAWNALLPSSMGRNDPAALFQPDVIAILKEMLEEKVDAKRARLERLLGGSVEALTQAIVAELALSNKTLGGKGEAGAKRSELLQALKRVVQGADDAAAPDTAPPAAVLPPDDPVGCTLREWLAADTAAEADDGDEGEGEKELTEYLHKLGGLEKVARPNPSTGEFGNWGILQAVARISASAELNKAGVGLQASIVSGKKIKGRMKLEVPVSAKDAPEAISEQWSKLTAVFNRPDTVIIAHIRNHYVMVYAMRDYARNASAGGSSESPCPDRAPEVVRELLIARKGQRPSTWISWEEMRGMMLKWNGHALMAIKATLPPPPSTFCARC